MIAEGKAKRAGLLATQGIRGSSNRVVLERIKQNRNMWIIDFGTDMSLEEAAKYEAPFEYVKKYVKPIRDKVRRAAHTKKWWLFGMRVQECGKRLKD